MARWKKWILFFLLCIVAFVIFTALEGLKIIEGGRWMWGTATYLALYYFIFVKKPKIKINEQDKVKYDFGKKLK